MNDSRTQIPSGNSSAKRPASRPGARGIGLARIPLMDLAAPGRALRRRLLAAASRVLDSGRFVLGPEGAAFEAEFSRLLGGPRCLGVASGSDALELALKAAGVGPGDEVIVPALTFIATANAAVAAGARPVFADVDPRTLTLDPEDAARRLGPRTRAIVPVHLYGRPAEMDRISTLARERGLKVVEDCAQSHLALHRGRPVGTLGDAGCFSFYPTKNLGAAGDAGAVVTADGALHERLRLLRNVGRPPGDKESHAFPCRHSRLDEIQAAILRVKLGRLKAWTRARRRAAALYRKGLRGLPLTLPPEDSGGTRHAYHLFVILTPRRDALAEALAREGIETGVYYPRPLHLQPAYAGEDAAARGLPHAERAARECLALPLWPGIPPSSIARVAAAARRFFSA